MGEYFLDVGAIGVAILAMVAMVAIIAMADTVGGDGDGAGAMNRIPTI